MPLGSESPSSAVSGGASGCVDCGSGEIVLFGVRVKVDPMRKSVSMNNLSEYEPVNADCNRRDDLLKKASAAENGGAAGYASADDALPQPANGNRVRKRGVPWTEDEHKLFLLGLQKVGKGDWKGISRNYVKTRTPTQVASHAQKYFLRQCNINRRRRASLFDITTDSVAAMPIEEGRSHHQFPSHPVPPLPLPSPPFPVTVCPVLLSTQDRYPTEISTLCQSNHVNILSPLSIPSSSTMVDLNSDLQVHPSTISLNLSLSSEQDQSAFQMVKPPCLDKLPMKRDIWNEEENGNYVHKNSKQGSVNWASFSKRSGLRRSGKNSRQRWSNEQKSDPSDNFFTPQEEELVIKLHAAIGSRWPIIAQQLPGRTEADVKILWNTKLRKKLSAMGIDPVTHKPFSQILADYGNIGAFPKHHAGAEQPQTHRTHSAFDLYSQFHAINIVTESSNYTNSLQSMKLQQDFTAESQSALNQDMSAFSWSDFLLEDDAFLASGQENEAIIDEQKCRGEKQDCEEVSLMNGAEASSSCSNGSFVEAMIKHQEAMFSNYHPGFNGDELYDF